MERWLFFLLIPVLGACEWLSPDREAGLACPELPPLPPGTTLEAEVLWWGGSFHLPLEPAPGVWTFRIPKDCAVGALITATSPNWGTWVLGGAVWDPAQEGAHACGDLDGALIQVWRRAGFPYILPWNIQRRNLEKVLGSRPWLLDQAASARAWASDPDGARIWASRVVGTTTLGLPGTGWRIPLSGGPVLESANGLWTGEFPTGYTRLIECEPPWAWAEVQWDPDSPPRIWIHQES